MKLVYASFILHPQVKKKRKSQPCGKPGQVNNKRRCVFLYATDGDGKNVFQHNFLFKIFNCLVI
jgi:hypothetical protein